MLQEGHSFANYQIIKRIGQGGMAEVYLAKAEGIGGFERLLALKVINSHLSTDKEFIQMLIDEAKLSVQLNHSNIVQIHDLGEYQGTYFIAMEFIDGQDLYQALVKCEEMRVSVPQEIAIFIAIETCAGLHYAHNKVDNYGRPLHIIHRDISPQNILISYDGAVKLVDFGIAKANERNTHTQQGILKGKYYYMSPEQAWGDQIDARSDLFSVGICLYETLAGEMLYTEEDGLKLLEQVRRADVPSLRSIRPDVAPELEGIIRKALSAEPYLRFQSAQEMGQVLSEYLYRNWPHFGRQNVVQFMQNTFGQQQPILPLHSQTSEFDVSTPQDTEDEFEATRALSTQDLSLIHLSQEDFESTQNISTHFLQQMNEQTAQVSIPDLSNDIDPLSTDLEQTRAITSNVLQHLHSPTAPIKRDFPSQIAQPAQEEATRAINVSMYQSLHSELSHAQPNGSSEDSTRVHSIPSNYSIEEPEEKTRAVNANQLTSVLQNIDSIESEERTRAVSANEFTAVLQTPRSNTPPQNYRPLPNSPTAKPPVFTSTTPFPSALRPKLSPRATAQIPASLISDPQPDQPQVAPSGHQPQFASQSQGPDPFPRVMPRATSIPDPNPRGAKQKEEIPTVDHQPKLDDLQVTNSQDSNRIQKKETQPTSSEDGVPKKNRAKKTKKPKDRKEKKSKKQAKNSNRARQKSKYGKIVYLVGGLLILGLLAKVFLPKLMKANIPEFVSVSISSVPAAAKIFIDGRDLGQFTPAEIPKIYLDRKHEITIKKEGYDTKKATLHFKKEKWSTRKVYQRKFFLQSLPGELTVTSSPSSAQVFYKDKFLGTTPLIKKDMPREEGEVVLIVKHRKFREPKPLVFSWGDKVQVNLFARFSR